MERGMHLWTAPMVGFMKDASEWGDYHQRLAGLAAGELTPGAHVLDAGCGLGYLSLALAPYCRKVTAVDIAPQALAVLEQNKRERGVSNVEIVRGDAFSVPHPEPYDAMVFCLFGSLEQCLGLARARCRGKVMLIRREEEAHQVTLKARTPRKHTLAQTLAWLEERGIPFECRRFSLRLDQPLRSMEDALLFFRTYSGEQDPETVIWEQVESRLISQDHPVFPWLLPVTRRLGLITLDAAALPHGITGEKEELE